MLEPVDGKDIGGCQEGEQWFVPGFQSHTDITGEIGDDPISLREEAHGPAHQSGNPSLTIAGPGYQKYETSNQVIPRNPSAVDPNLEEEEFDGVEMDDDLLGDALSEYTTGTESEEDEDDMGSDSD